MSEEKDVAQVEAEMKALEAKGGDAHNGVGPKGVTAGDAVPPQLEPTEGLPERQAVRRRQERVVRMLHDFEPETQEAIRKSLPEDLLAHADSGTYEPTRGANGRHWAPESDTREQEVAQQDHDDRGGDRSDHRGDHRSDGRSDDESDDRAEPAGAGGRFPWWGRSRGEQ